MSETEQNEKSTDYNDFNRKLIAEYRANGGKVSGMFAGAPLLLLTTTGAKSGQPRVARVHRMLGVIERPLDLPAEGDELTEVLRRDRLPERVDVYVAARHPHALHEEGATGHRDAQRPGWEERDRQRGDVAEGDGDEDHPPQ